MQLEALHEGGDRHVRPAQPEEVQQDRLRVLQLQEAAVSVLDRLDPERRGHLRRIGVLDQERDVLDTAAAVADVVNGGRVRALGNAGYRPDVEDDSGSAWWVVVTPGCAR